MRSILLTLVALSLAGCANMETGSQNRYQAELNRLEQTCRERGGVLEPTGSGGSIRPQEDNFCRITTGPSRRVGT